MQMFRKTQLVLIAAICAVAINVHAEGLKISNTAMPNFLVLLWNAVSGKTVAGNLQQAAPQANRLAGTRCPIDRETGRPEFGCEENTKPRRDDDGKPNPCTGRLCPDYTPDE
jgi:hypothetical protein